MKKEDSNDVYTNDSDFIIYNDEWNGLLFIFSSA